MSGNALPRVKTLGLFEQRFAGDNCLMNLASRRFLAAGMGAEMQAGSLENLEWLMSFRPWREAPVIVHLPRDLNLLDEPARKRILDLASRFAGAVSGFVLHDHQAIVARRAEYLEAARQMNRQLEIVNPCPTLFIEYAVGLDPAEFIGFFAAISDLAQLSSCIDIGHVGIRAARAAYARGQGGEDVCALKSQGPQLQKIITEVEAAVASGRTAVFDLVEALGALKKPLHFHLHDGHPLSTFSPFGVSDHLSFFTEIPLNFEHQGRMTVAPMFGPAGLVKLVNHAIQSIESRAVSFTLEIHPTGEKLTLGDAAPLFAHWTDKTNAEQMNHWLAVLRRNHVLLLEAIQAAQPAAS